MSDENPNKTETRLINALDEAAVFEQLQPMIKAALKYGGGSEAIIKKSQVIAASRLIELLNSDKDEVKLKAITQVLDRSLGKAIERKFNVYADLEGMNEKEIDRRLKELIGRNRVSGADIIDSIVEDVTPSGSKES